MPETIRNCPECGARVWPLPDGTCPACRRLSFAEGHQSGITPNAAEEPEATVRATSGTDLDINAAELSPDLHPNARELFQDLEPDAEKSVRDVDVSEDYRRRNAKCRRSALSVRPA